MSSFRAPLPVLGALLLAAAASSARAAEERPPVNRLIPSAFIVFRVTPDGQDNLLALTFKQRIGESDDLLFKTRFWSVSAMGAWNPANWSARLEALVEPIAILQLRAAYDLKGYFGGFGALISGTSPGLDISYDGIKLAGERGEEQSGLYHGFSLEPALQAAFGPFAIRNTFTFEYALWNVRGGDTVVWDPGGDLRRPVAGWTLTDTATAGYLDERLFAGVMYQWMKPVSLPPDNQVHRLGVVGTYTFFDRGPGRGGWFNKPTILVLVLFNLQHPARSGPIPMVVAGFGAEGDLLGPSPAKAAAP